ncbi:glutathione S-transferase N-terminal domain-containing protein, partial [Alphaproteobacteria bacterium]|nr:glutathione S-transferase N-terminal domain-containing protein [Alphaproteobacteria bacterium]
MNQIVELMGAPGSPYTRKMLAAMRYRRIPFRIEWQSLPGKPRRENGVARPKAKVGLLPTFYLPNEQGEIVAVTDSTPLIRRFEQEYEGRNLIPSDPALAFVNSLIED